MVGRHSITISEYDKLVPDGSNVAAGERVHMVPVRVYSWLEDCCRITAGDSGRTWIQLSHWKGTRAVQVTSHVGVVRGPDGFQVEILPKIDRVTTGDTGEPRQLLLRMLRCLPRFRHVRLDRASVAAMRMPLLEVFIAEFLDAVRHVVKRGLRSAYISRQDNIVALRGRLLIAHHLRHNVTRADRFYAEFDEFSANRAENRLLRAALHQVLAIAHTLENQRLGRELEFAFADIPASPDADADFRRVRIERSMGHYDEALAWARLILQMNSPLTGAGSHSAPSLLFPMEALFEAYVARHLSRQLSNPYTLHSQSNRYHLVCHQKQNWFLMKPDLLVREAGRDLVVLDTKWKLIDGVEGTGARKYGLLQQDVYQLQAYGLSYLRGSGDVLLVYPRTEAFQEPLEVFEFLAMPGLRLWVLPFCLESATLILPSGAKLEGFFKRPPAYSSSAVEGEPAQPVS